MSKDQYNNLPSFNFSYQQENSDLGLLQGNHFKKRLIRLGLEDLSRENGASKFNFANPDWSVALQLYSPFLHQAMLRDALSEFTSPDLYRSSKNRTELYATMRQRFSFYKEKFGIYAAQKIMFTEILLLDLYRSVSFIQLVQMISLLARIIVADVLERIWPVNTLPLPALISMGKLGAEEVNYSSDIDLLFVARSEDIIEESARYIQLLMKELGQAGPEGFLYRVDARLRPQGQSGGKLLRTVESYLNYYRTSGQTWERQALLKASFLAGDESLGNTFIGVIRDYIYQKQPSAAEVREIQDVKHLIEKDLAENQNRNIKLMSGGIRDIEFLIQTMQLFHGYANEGLRHPNHLLATKSLSAHNFLSDQESEKISKNYILFREIEHRLQCAQFSPVRLLPDHAQAWDHIAFSFPDMAEGNILIKEMRERRAFVQESFHHRIEDTIKYLKKHQVVFAYLEQFDKSKVAYFLQGFRDEYIETFTPLEIADHYNRLREISFKTPLNIFVDPGEMPDDWKVSLVAIDKPFVFSFLVGELAIEGLQLDMAKSFSFRSQLHIRSQENFTDFSAPPMITHMKVRGKKYNLDRWIEKVKEIFSIVTTSSVGAMADYKLDLRRRFFQRPQEHIFIEDFSHDYLVKATNILGLDATVLVIRGKDYPGFLFESITALQEMGFKILECDVDTENGIVHDRFLISHINDKHIDDSQLSGLEKRLSLMKFFSRHLDKVAEPAAAYQKFFDMVGKMEVSDREDFVFTEDLMKRIGLLLGSGEFVRHRFFLSEGLHFLKQTQEQKYYETEEKKLNIRQNLGFLEDFDVYLRSENDANVLGKKLSTELEPQLEKWREGVLYEVCLAQVQGEIPYNLLSEYFDEIISAYINYFLKYREIFHLRKRNISERQWFQSSRWNLIALGKFGGLELGYGSDLEIIFLYEFRKDLKHSEQHDPQIFYDLMRDLSKALPDTPNNLFHVDLRLRPHGNSGPLAGSLKQFRQYYQEGGGCHPYEKQALIKGRVIVEREWSRQENGETLQETFYELRKDVVFSGKYFPVREIQKLRDEQKKNSESRHLKFGPGGLVAIEYSVQQMQMAVPKLFLDEELDERVFSPSTFQAIRGLRNMRLISEYEAAMLRHTYSIFRIVINALRFSIGRDDAYILPQPGTPHWERIWKLVQGELVCSRSENLEELIRVSQHQISTWWQIYTRRLPKEWLH